MPKHIQNENENFDRFDYMKIKKYIYQNTSYDSRYKLKKDVHKAYKSYFKWIVTRIWEKFLQINTKNKIM